MYKRQSRQQPGAGIGRCGARRSPGGASWNTARSAHSVALPYHQTTCSGRNTSVCSSVGVRKAMVSHSPRINTTSAHSEHGYWYTAPIALGCSLPPK